MSKRLARVLLWLASGIGALGEWLAGRAERLLRRGRPWP